MKRIYAVILAALLAAGAFWRPTALAAPVDTGFVDVDPSAWYAEAISYVKTKGLMGGSGDTFSPDATTTRAQLTAILYRAAGSPVPMGKAEFSDVAETAYYADAVNWAVGEGLITGYGNGTFGSNDSITRQQLATILWRSAGSPETVPNLDFEDAAEISAYAAQAVTWATENQIINGNGGKFLPASKATRAQLAVILKNYMESGAAEQVVLFDADDAE